MRASVYCWCPAYALTDVAQLQRTEREAGWLAESLGLKSENALRLRSDGVHEVWLESEERICECERALDHRVLLAARGGYGCVDLAPALLASRQASAGTLIGYSDLTVLHCCWRRKGWGETLYGFLAGVPHEDRARTTTRDLYRGDGLVLSTQSDPAVRVVNPGQATGWCFAACLRVLTGLVGTPAFPELKGSILALEDVDEKPYQIDRDLHQLHASGGLDGIRGLVFGRFPATLPEEYRGPSLDDVVSQWSRRLGVPAIVGLPFGHEPDPLTLPCGRNAVLTVENDGWRFALQPRKL